MLDLGIVGQLAGVWVGWFTQVAYASEIQRKVRKFMKESEEPSTGAVRAIECNNGEGPVADGEPAHFGRVDSAGVQYEDAFGFDS